jgi:hypothetical protein
MTEELVIHWHDKDTNHTGHGQPVEQYEAIRRANVLNSEYSDRIHHWTEPPEYQISAQVPGAGFMGEGA